MGVLLQGLVPERPSGLSQSSETGELGKERDDDVRKSIPDVLHGLAALKEKGDALGEAAFLVVGLRDVFHVGPTRRMKPGVEQFLFGAGTLADGQLRVELSPEEEPMSVATEVVVGLDEFLQLGV